MKVLNLRCTHGHVFEGWFGADDDFLAQNGRGLVECPLCADKIITQLPSAPRLNLSGAREPEPASVAKPRAADLQAAWLETMRQVVANTEDVGERFAEKARSMHYGEERTRGIRGQASAEERAALLDEGIETMALPLPAALKGPVQ